MADDSDADLSIDEDFFARLQARRNDQPCILQGMYPLVPSLGDAVSGGRGKRCVVLIADHPSVLQSAVVRVMLHPLVTADAVGFMLWTSALRSTRDRAAFLVPQLLAQMDRQETYNRAIVMFMDLRQGYKRITGICGVSDVDSVFRAAVPVQNEPDLIPISLQITAQTTADAVRDTLASLLLFETSRLALLACQNTPLAPEILDLLAGSFLVVNAVSLINCGLTDDALDRLAPVLMTAEMLSIAGNGLLRSPDFVGLLGRRLEMLDIADTRLEEDATETLGKLLPSSLEVLRLSRNNHYIQPLILNHVSKKLTVKAVEVVGGGVFPRTFENSANKDRPPDRLLTFTYPLK
jgi:hypothetical protein